MMTEGASGPPVEPGRRFLLTLRDNGTPRVREIAQELLDEEDGLEGVERALDRMCTRSVMEGWKWWRPSWSSGYHQGLTDAWRVAFDAFMHAESSVAKAEHDVWCVGRHDESGGCLNVYPPTTPKADS